MKRILVLLLSLNGQARDLFVSNFGSVGISLGLNALVQDCTALTICATDIAVKRLFPVRAVLTFEHGSERMRYEVKCITSQKPEGQPAELFLPPAGYRQLEPLLF